MSKRYFILSIAALCCSPARPQAIERSPLENRWSPSTAFEFVARANGTRYFVRVAVPTSPPPPQGFPILYVLDGDAYFAGYSDAARISDLYGGPNAPAIVVGIGYAGGAKAAIDGRRRDFGSSALTSAGTPVEAKSARGSDAFLEVLRSELNPLVSRRAKVDPNRRVLIGHSLGGLFAVHVLLTDPGAFSTYVVLSPSIWSDDGAVLRELPGFEDHLSQLKTEPSVFIGVGGGEEKPMADDHRMVSNAKELVLQLRRRMRPSTRIDFHVFDGEPHSMMAWAAIGYVLRFALGSKE